MLVLVWHDKSRNAGSRNDESSDDELFQSCLDEDGSILSQNDDDVPFFEI
jgi:hypothetical protein